MYLYIYIHCIYIYVNIYVLVYIYTYDMLIMNICWATRYIFLLFLTSSQRIHFCACTHTYTYKYTYTYTYIFSYTYTYTYTCTYTCTYTYTRTGDPNIVSPISSVSGYIYPYLTYMCVLFCVGRWPHLYVITRNSRSHTHTPTHTPPHPQYIPNTCSIPIPRAET